MDDKPLALYVDTVSSKSGIANSRITCMLASGSCGARHFHSHCCMADSFMIALSNETFQKVYSRHQVSDHRDRGVATLRDPLITRTTLVKLDVYAKQNGVEENDLKSTFI